MTALPLSAEQEDLVGAFLADLRAAGLHPDHAFAWGARAFLYRFGGTQGWQRLSLEEQLACNVKIHRSILDATMELLAEVGYAGLTMEGVAARAGVAKTTVYRWWPSKPELVVAAAEDLAAKVRKPHSGKLRDDLVTLLRDVPGHKCLQWPWEGDFTLAEVPHGKRLKWAFRLLPRYVGAVRALLKGSK